MDILEVLSKLALIATAIIAFVTAIIALKSLKSSERSLQFNVYNEILEMLEKMRPARHLLYEKVPREPSTSLNGLTEEERKQLDELLRSFDKLGLLVSHGVVPIEFVLDFYSYPVVVAWHRLGLYIKEEREKRNQPDHMGKFERLAVKAKEYRDKYHPGEETFLREGKTR
jgi:hypothetical protein